MMPVQVATRVSRSRPCIAKAEMITTWYVRADEGAPLHTHFCERFGLSETDKATGTRYEPSETILLTSDTLPHAPDSQMLQLIFNARGDTPVDGGASPWCVLREWLMHGLPFGERWIGEILFGWTVTYAAEVGEREESLDTTMETLLAAKWIPHPQTGEPFHIPIHKTEVKGGQLWLLASPHRTEDSAPTVYAALAPYGGIKLLAKDSLVGVGKATGVLWPDLLGHKSYFLMRQYRRNGRLEAYKELLKGTGEATWSLLDQQHSGSIDAVQRQRVLERYRELRCLVPLLAEIYTSLQEQRYNMMVVQRNEGTVTEVVQWHEEHLHAALEELEVQSERGRRLLEADSVLLSEDEAYRDKRMQEIVAYVGIILTFLQVALGFASIQPSIGFALIIVCFIVMGVAGVILWRWMRRG